MALRDRVKQARIIYDVPVKFVPLGDRANAFMWYNKLRDVILFHLENTGLHKMAWTMPDGTLIVINNVPGVVNTITINSPSPKAPPPVATRRTEWLSPIISNIIFLVFVSANKAGTIASITSNVSIGGVNYKVDDILFLSGGYQGTVEVLAVDSTGKVQTVILNSAGYSYTIGVKATTGGSGIGCQIEINNVFEADPYYELKYIAPPDGIGGDYRVLIYSFNPKEFKGLTAAGTSLSGLSISDTGTSLAIQSGTGIHVAILANPYTYNETIDNAEYQKTGWNSTVQIFGNDRTVGNGYDYNLVKQDTATGIKYVPDKTSMVKSGSPSRHGYVIGSDGYVEQCKFSRKQTLLGTYPMWRELSRIIEDPFYQLWSNRIVYKKTPADNDYIDGTLIGNDTAEGTPETEGYKWETFQNVGIFDKDNALVKIERNNNTKGPAYSYPFTLGLVISDKWTDDNGHYSFTTTTYRGDFTTQVVDRACTREEEIRIGTNILEKTSYEETDYGSNGFVWIPGGFPAIPAVSTTGDRNGYTYWVGVDSASGGISSPLSKYNMPLVTFIYKPPPGSSHLSWSVSWHVIQIGAKHEATKIGDRNLHVTAFDNYHGAENWIVMYKKDTIAYKDTDDWSNANDGTAPVHIKIVGVATVTAKYYIAYKIKGDSVVKKEIGSDCQHHSCQINNGYMVYTYTVWESSRFKHRIVGIIKLSDGIVHEVTLMDDDKRLNNFTNFHHAAIGVATNIVQDWPDNPTPGKPFERVIEEGG
jgi:hypothetical protein